MILVQGELLERLSFTTTYMETKICFTTVILDDPVLFEEENFQLVYSICDELINRLVGYADTLLSVHAGSNSYNAEYKR